MDKVFLLPSLKGAVHIKPVSTDNTVFKLHYRVTTIVLVVASLMISTVQFFGEPISCIMQNKGPPDSGLHSVIESYCWVESTFTLPKSLHKKVGDHVPYPGVDKYVQGDEILLHSYYQWVCVVLFLQGCLFYIPHMLWKSWEGGKISNLLQELNKPTLAKDKLEQKYKDLTKYFVDQDRTHSDYFFKFFLCEILNFVNVVGQMFVIDKFLHGEFTTYGSEVFKFMMEDQEDRVDPMIRVFPRMTKCTFHQYGPSGDIQKMDNFCVLPMNIINEKVYAFLWFWFVLLAIFSGLAIIYRLVMIMSPSSRFLLTRSTNILTKRDRLGTVLNYLDYGDWFLLYMLGNNIDNVYFMELIDDMAMDIDKKTQETKSNFSKSTASGRSTASDPV